MNEAAEIQKQNAARGSMERVPFGDDPGFFFRLLATSKKPRMIFYVIAFVIASFWFGPGTLLPILAILAVVELGPWSWPRQIIWGGKKAATLSDAIADFLAQMNYRSADVSNSWTLWAGPQFPLKPWRSAPPLYTRFADGTFILRGDRWAISRLRTLFDSPQFKELRRQIRPK
jgi:hypothetical protein